MLTRIAIFSHSSKLGGAELGLYRYVRAQQHFQIHVFLLEDGPLAELLRTSGVVVTVPPTDSKVAKVKLALRLRRSMKSHEFDIALTNTLRAATIYALMGGPSDRHLFCRI